MQNIILYNKKTLKIPKIKILKHKIKFPKYLISKAKILETIQKKAQLQYFLI
jgi:hypothetical protein